MLEDAKIEGLLVRLDAPGNSMFFFDTDPSHEIGLDMGEKNRRQSAQELFVGIASSMILL